MITIYMLQLGGILFCVGSVIKQKKNTLTFALLEEKKKFWGGDLKEQHRKLQWQLLRVTVWFMSATTQRLEDVWNPLWRFPVLSPYNRKLK